MTRDDALLAIELAARLGTTPALRAAFAPCVRRARVVLAGGEAGPAQVSVMGSGVPRGAETRTARRSQRRAVGVLSKGPR